MKIDGACHCGYIRVEGEADPEKTTVCHCTDCQVGAGSAFRVNVPVPGATFRITGRPATYLKTTAESGNPRLQAFCPRCGSPIYSTSPGEGQQASYMVRVGILRQRRDFVPGRQNWFRSALPWVSSLATCTGTRSKRSSCDVRPDGWAFGRNPYVRHEAARVHHVARWHCRRVAACSASAAVSESRSDWASRFAESGSKRIRRESGLDAGPVWAVGCGANVRRGRGE